MKQTCFYTITNKMYEIIEVVNGNFTFFFLIGLLTAEGPRRGKATSHACSPFGFSIHIYFICFYYLNLLNYVQWLIPSEFHNIFCISDNLVLYYFVKYKLYFIFFFGIFGLIILCSSSMNYLPMLIIVSIYRKKGS